MRLETLSSVGILRRYSISLVLICLIKSLLSVSALVFDSILINYPSRRAFLLCFLEIQFEGVPMMIVGSGNLWIWIDGMRGKGDLFLFFWKV